MLYSIIFSFYLLLVVLTCLYQLDFPRLQHFLSLINVFRILPRWTFFAPNPGVSDYHLLFRTKNKSGEVSPFVSIPLRNKKSLLNAFWNPHKRAQKALNDFVQEIRRWIARENFNEETQHLIKLSFSYVVTLHYCTELIRKSGDVESVQFTILETFGYSELAEPRLILNSDFHQL